VSSVVGTKCALCLEEAELRNSHIIPEFLYRALYDDKHRFHEISVAPNKRNNLKQKGFREPLLCENCEQRLSVNERYASQFLIGGVGIGIRQEGERLYLPNLDYPKLKLFQLAILWRAGVSSLPAFSQVTLGPHAEQIRTMLVNGDPGGSDDYGCLMFALMLDQGQVQGLIVQPTWARLAGMRAYRFVFGGLIFVYVVSSTAPPAVLRPNFLKSDGTAVVKFEQLRNLGFLMHSLNDMMKHGKFDQPIT
jgi:hypothetical protein